MKKTSRTFLGGFISLFIAGALSCGIENYAFLEPVPSGNIRVELNSKAYITLPDIDITEYYYFSHFTIYYRIYISVNPFPGRIDEGSMNGLNPTLYSDYTGLVPYTADDTNIGTSVGTLFKNRNYQVLELQGANIERDILSQNALGKTITLDFAQIPGSTPFFVIDTNQYYLQRSTGNGLFTPVPQDRYFINTSDLYASGNISTTKNADVVDINTPGSRYTYVAMYIVVTGIDDNLSPIYSRPTFIGILRLPETS